MLATRMRMGGGGGPVDCTYVTSAVNTANLTTYTFAGQSLGDAAADRYIVVVASNFESTIDTLSSLTIAGVAATNVLETSVAANTVIAIAAVPTGTTGDIVVTWAGAVTRCGIGVYRLTGLKSATPTATAKTNVIVGDALSASLVIPAGGCGIGYVCAVGDGVARTWTWTNLTENFDETVESTTTHSGAMSSTAGTATRTATASGTLSSDAGRASLVLAAWR